MDICCFVSSEFFIDCSRASRTEEAASEAAPEAGWCSVGVDLLGVGRGEAFLSAMYCRSCVWSSRKDDCWDWSVVAWARKAAERVEERGVAAGGKRERLEEDRGGLEEGRGGLEEERGRGFMGAAGGRSYIKEDGEGE